MAEHSGAHPAVVALMADDMGEEVVVGFGSLSPYRPRAAYSTTVEDSVYVAEGSQRLGIGRAILEELLRLAEAHGFHAVIGPDRRGQRRLRWRCTQSCGFEMIGTEREVGRKFGRWLDVVCMERLIGEAPPQLAGGRERHQLLVGRSIRQAFAVKRVHPGQTEARRQPDAVGLEQLVHRQFLSGHVPARSLGRTEEPGHADAVQYADRRGRAHQAPTWETTTAEVAPSQTRPSLPTKMASSAPLDSAQRLAAMLTA